MYNAFKHINENNANIKPSALDYTLYDELRSKLEFKEFSYMGN